MKTSSMLLFATLLLLVLAMISFGRALVYCNAMHISLGWSALPPVVLTLCAMLCLIAAEHFASRRD